MKMMNASNHGEDRSKLPYHFVTFVEIFFAVVLGASIFELHTFLFPPAPTALSFWALIAVYFTAITSWIGWHKSTSKYPYTDSGAGQARSILDAVIVVIYAALLFFGSRLSDFVDWYLWGFVTVFFLYLISGGIRQVEYNDRKASKSYLIIWHGVIVLTGAITFTVLSRIIFQFATVLTWVLVLLPFGTMISYRWFREWQVLSWKPRIKNKMTIAVDMDGVLVEQVVPVLEKLKQEIDINLNKSDINDWEYPFSGTDIKTEIEKAEREEKFVQQMPPIEGASEALRFLSEQSDIVIATSREISTDSWSRDWLNSHNIPFKRFINTRSQGKALPDVDLLIDDYIGNVENFIRNGPTNRWAILFAQPWNHNVTTINDLIASHRVRIAHSWQSILAILGYDPSR